MLKQLPVAEMLNNYPSYVPMKFLPRILDRQSSEVNLGRKFEWSKVFFET